MPRLPEIEPAGLEPEQRRIYDEIMRGRGHVRGPFAVWLRNAELCENTVKLQEMFAARIGLERRLLELMILVAARLARAQYAWFVHEPYALKFGIAPDIVQAIRAGRTPKFERDEEQLIYDLTMELNRTHTLADASFERGMAHFGEKVMVELVSAIGFYAMVAMTLNAFRVPVPDGTEPLA